MKDSSESIVSPSAVTARLIIDELIRLGMRDAVVCPGSRSAPLARAVVLAAHAGRVRMHVRIDERSAAFLALGLAAETGQVTPVITTSGTAVANLLPAMVEATYTGIPLMALTADRPASYEGAGANQTIAQSRLFTDASAVEFDLDGTQEVTQHSAAVIRGRVDRVVSAMGLRHQLGESCHAAAPNVGQRIPGRVCTGPAHLNVRFVEPLVPNDDSDIPIPEGREGGAPWTEISAAASSAATNSADTEDSATATRVRTGVYRIDVSKRTLVIAGSNAPQLEALQDLPTVAEPNSYAPERPVHPLAAGTFAQIPPEQIVVVGRPTLHRGVAKLLANPAIDVTIIKSDDTPDFPDVHANARRVVREVVGVEKQDRQWLKVCEAASELAVKAVRDALSESVEAGEELTGFHVAAALTDSVRTGDQVVLGASSAVRDASFAGLPFPGVDTYAGRGAAGIDGTVATAIGIALARDRENPDAIRAPRTIALMGDLTFQHDAGALAIGDDEPRPENLTIIVANDSGGGIFETLEAGAPAIRRHFERIFATPQNVDFAALCEAYHVDYQHVFTWSELLETLDEDADNYGVRVIEVATTRQGRRALNEKLAYLAELDV